MIYSKDSWAPTATNTSEQLRRREIFQQFQAVEQTTSLVSSVVATAFYFGSDSEPAEQTRETCSMKFTPTADLTVKPFSLSLSHTKLIPSWICMRVCCLADSA